MKLHTIAALTCGIIMLTAQPAAAEASAPYELAILKDGGSVYLSLVAAEATDIEGMSLQFDYDGDAFSMGGIYTPEGISFTGNNTDGMFVLYGVEDLHLEAGDTLAAVGFTASAAMDGRTEYTFACTIEDAYSDSMDEFSWVGQTLACTYRDSTAETGMFTPLAGDAEGMYTVTFADDDGTILSTQSVDAVDPYVVLYEPEREGWNFTGWTLDGKPFNEETKIDGSVTLAATWEESGDDANAGSRVSSSGSMNPTLVAVLAATAIGVLAFVIRKIRS